MLSDLAAGFRGLRHQPLLLGVFAVTIVFNLFAFPFMSMIPVIGKDVLDLDATAVGLLASAEGAGALCGAIFMALAIPKSWFRYFYFGSVVLYLLFAVGFSLSSAAWLSGALLLAAGVSSAAFAALQSALVMLNTPSAARAQMMGVLSMCIGTAPLGFLQIGMLADALGAATACTVVAAEGLVVLAFVAVKFRQLFSVQP